MLDRQAIAARLPHDGAMCLLERVLHWDGEGISCATFSHRALHNPLRDMDGLPVWAGIEYAAQAAALHGSLASEPSGMISTPRAGVLAALRGVRACAQRLDGLDGELLVEATLLHRDPAGAVYRFAVGSVNADACGAPRAITGQFTLMYVPPARATP
jgi:predicted hotdog family 3-hydroxylacyl-ACP dehydratase